MNPESASSQNKRRVPGTRFQRLGGFFVLAAAGLCVAADEPGIRLVSPKDGAVFLAGEPILLQAEGRGTEFGTIQKVEFVGRTLIGEAATAPFAFSWEGAPPGIHSVSVLATTAAGQVESWKSTIAVLPQLDQGRVVHVDKEYGGADADGSARAPYTAIQEAVDRALDGDTIKAAAGEYRGAVVIREKNLRLIGGYTGASAAIYSQGGSGDFTSRAPRSTRILGEGADPVIEVDFNGGVQWNIIDGFTVSGGQRGILAHTFEDPAGKYFLLMNNTVTANSNAASWVAGVAINGVSAGVLGNTISGNTAPAYAGLSLNGTADTAGLIKGNLLESNISTEDWSHAAGIAFAGRDTTGTITRNVVRNNRAFYGAGIFVDGNTGPNFIRLSFNTVIRNQGFFGTGEFIDGGATAIVENEIIAWNEAIDGQLGGAFAVDSGPATRATLINCTVAHNAGYHDEFSPNGNGLIINEDSGGDSVNVEVKNCIFWRNAMLPGGKEINAPGGGVLKIEFSNVDQPLQAGANLSLGTGMLRADPLFADPQNDDFHLKSVSGRWNHSAANGQGAWFSDDADSPGVDAGDPNSTFQNEPVPNGGRINLGAYGNTAEASQSSSDLNLPPTGILLSSLAVAENRPPGTEVGTLAAIDANTGDNHLFLLAPGTGDTDNAAFRIDGRTLHAAGPFDFEEKNQYSIRLRVEDRGGMSFEQAFTILVMDENDPPQVRLASPAAGLQLTPGAILSFQAVATDQDDPIVSIEFDVDGERVATGAAQGGVWLGQWTAASAGRFLVSARAVDARGTAGHSEAAVVTVAPALASLPAGIPSSWESRGVGGGGALFSPSINPHNPNEIYVGCDMSEWFRTTDLGAAWDPIHFEQLQGGNLTSPVQFTSDPKVLYALNYAANAVRPAKSLDGGLTWTVLPADPTEGECYSVFADPNATDRLLVSGYDTLFFSRDGGASFQAVFTASDLHVAGAFFDGANFFIGARPGLVASTDGGVTFSLSPAAGIPATEEIVSFAGAKQAGTTRFFCVTLEAGGVYPAVTGGDHWSYRGVYRLDYDTVPDWEPVINGIGAAHPFFVSMARDSIDVAYLAGSADSFEAPVVLKTTTGGDAWEPVFITANNQNVQTGWQGDRGDRAWSYGEYVLGLNVCASDPDRVVVSDLGFVHLTTDGGATWRQAYVHPADANSSGGATPKRKAYRGVGLENTSSWWLTWANPNTLFASFTDLRGLRSVDAGLSWSYDFSGLDLNSSYHCVKHPSTGRLYVAVSSVHDLYQSTYLTDRAIDGAGQPARGAVLYSDDNGVNWKVLHDFGHPVLWLALDPNNANRLYASAPHSVNGGIYVSSDIEAGADSVWTKLSEPPRTERHPFNFHVLNDGGLVCAYSGRRNEEGEFTPSSGAFLSRDGGVSWQDRSDPGMHYWTKDLVIDPHDSFQQTWYAAVFSGWGGPPNDLGGLYKTTNQGLSWTRITGDRLRQVESCAIHPANPNIMFVTTEEQGLWQTTNLNSTTPAFSPVSSYPFKHPTRVFYNPHDVREIWVTSFGNGLRVGRIQENPLRFRFMRISSAGMFESEIEAAFGRIITISGSDDLRNWEDIFTGPAPEGAVQFQNSMADRNRRFFRARFESR